MPKRQLKDLRVVLTGASSGIGWHLAKILAAQNAKLIITARRADRLAQLQQEIKAANGVCHCVTGDITDELTRRSLLSTADEKFQGFDVLINNAGDRSDGPVRRGLAGAIAEAV